MRMKSMYPIVVTKNLEETVRFYEVVMECHVKHRVERPFGTLIVMTNEAGNDFEIMEAPKEGMPNPFGLKPGVQGFRVNVDDIQAAFVELKAQGCEVIVPPTQTELGQNMLVKDPTGISLTIIQHEHK